MSRRSATLRECVKFRIATSGTSTRGACARRLFDALHIPYAESRTLEPYAIGGSGLDVVAAESTWRDVNGLVEGLERLSRPGQRLLGEDGAVAHLTRQRIQRLDGLLSAQAERVLLHYLLPHRRLLLPLVSEGMSRSDTFQPRTLYGSWRRRVMRRLKIASARLTADLTDIDSAFDEMAAACRDGRPFAAGSAPGADDRLFAAMTELLRLSAPDRPVPAADRCPPELRSLAERLRAHPAGQLAARVEAALPRSTLVAEDDVRELEPPGFLANPRLLLFGARLARRFGPVIRFGRSVVLTRGEVVTEALAADNLFVIEPINRRRINDVNHGDFILGLDAGEQHRAEHRHLYAAYRPYDLDSVAALVSRESGRLLDAAAMSDGRLDIVNSYARPTAARTATMLLGIAGPTEADLMRAARRMFHHTFLNLGDDRGVRDAAVAASLEVAAWFRSEVERRRGAPGPDDMLERMLRAIPAGADEARELDLIRRNLTGMLVGAIDTTATTVANIAQVLLTRPGLRRRVEADIEFPVRFRAWCWEVLRLNPHNPLVLREAAADVDVGGYRVAKGKRVVALTLAAMHDPETFPTPERLEVGRPESGYFHFGSGLHRCAGTEFNRIQVPELVRQLFLRKPVPVGPLLMDGPFPDRLVVRLQRAPAAPAGDGPSRGAETLATGVTS